MTPRAPDLTAQPPRSPKERLGGYVHLGRMIDKARAKTAGTIGEYIYPCPLDRALLDFLAVNDKEFLAVATDWTDQDVLRWIQEKTTPRSPVEIRDWNEAFLARAPKDEESLHRFLEIRNRVARHRTDVTTWVDLLDLEEGR
jgi:hypothetical protein